MRHLRFALRAPAALVPILALLSCGGDAGPTDSADQVASVVVSPESSTIFPQQTVQLSATPQNSSGAPLNGKAVSWTTESGGTASVDGSGLVLGLTPGTATIRATSEGKSGTALITVADGGISGPAGATITGAGGAVTLIVPPGAVAQNTAFTVTPLPAPPAGLADFVVGTGYSLGPDGVDFTQPITVRLRYETANLPPGTEPAQLVVWRHNGASWTPLSGAAVDVVARLVSGQTSHFSSFAIAPAPGNPVPTLSVVDPDSAPVGGPNMSLLVTGTNFVNGSVVRWNGGNRNTNYVSSTHLTVTIPSQDLVGVGQATVTVFNPAPGGGTSNGVGFTINPPSGAAIMVNSLADTGGGECTLRNAIEAANTNQIQGGCPAGTAVQTDVIEFDEGLNGTITLVGGLPLVTQDLRIDGDERIVISGNDLHRPFRVNAGTALELRRIGIRNGSAPDGGGIFNDAGTVTLTDVEMTGNRATNGSGGAIRNNPPGILNITGGTFTGNTATEAGGAIRNVPGAGDPPSHGVVTITGAYFHGNTSAGAGGAIDNGGILTITDSELRGTNQAANGGALTNGNTATLHLNRSLIASNLALSGGAGIFVFGGTVNVTNSTITGNLAQGSGGAALAGGGITAAAGTVNLRNTTIVLNTSQAIGGGAQGAGVHQAGTAVFNFWNTLVGPQNGGGSGCTPSSVGYISNGNNLDGGNSCNFNQLSDRVNTPWGGDTSLGLNGGPTLTHALLGGSAAINAGSNAVCAASPVSGVDQRGFPRNDGQCDIGAIEVQGP